MGHEFLFGAPETLIASSKKAAAAGTEDFVRTACWIGKQECGIIARRIDGRVVKLDGDPDNPRNLGTLCPKGQAQIHTLYDPDRILRPLRRTNPKGQPGEWKAISWDEAIALVAEKLSTAAATDKRYAGWVAGRDRMKPIFGQAIPGAFGLTSYARKGQDCDGPAEQSLEATWGAATVPTPDLRHCNYLICYWGLTTSGGPGLCQITLPREVADAKARGMKVVAISPYARPVAHFADEWVPVKPGTDMAFWLAVLHVLLRDGFVDQDFLKKYTNATALVLPDGTIARAGDAVLVGDAATKAAVAEGPGVDPALFGEFDVDGQPAKPALQVLKDQLAENTPEWAAKVCDVSAEQIDRIAHDLGRNAMIGSTTTIDGVTVPLRPVAYGAHGVPPKWWSAFQTHRAILLTFMVLGAIESAGSVHFWDKEGEDPAGIEEELLDHAAKDPVDLDLRKSKWFPFESAGYLAFPEVVNNLEKYGLDHKLDEMALLCHAVNPLLSSRPADKALDAWKKFGFVAMLLPSINATADYVADVVLPCGTLDKWEGPLPARTLYQKADTVRAPAMKPRGESKSELEIYLDLAEKMGKLSGDAGYLAAINKALKISLPLDQKPGVETILEAWAQAKHKVSLEDFMNGAVKPKDIPATDLYLTIADPPLLGVKARFYQEAFLKTGQVMREHGGPADFSERWTPYPRWTTPPMEKSPPEYDLVLMDFKMIEYKQTRTENPLLRELAPENPLVMNTRTAKKRGLEDGDLVEIESHNPISGETARTRTRLAATEAIRPDTVGMTHHVHRLDLPSVNQLLLHGPGFWDIGSGWFSHVKVKVKKVEG